MKRLLLLLVVATTLVFACKNRKPKGGQNGVPDDFALEIRHVGCRGSCPDYRINVDAKGNAKWYGHHAVEMMGNYHKSLESKTVRELVDIVGQYNFWDFEEVYGGGVADLPSVITKVTMNGKTKSVEDIRYAPQPLKEMEAKLESTIGKDGWIKDEE